jgi:acyl-CoA oxidase
LKNEFDIFQTAEGDRTVLLQQLAKHLLSGFRKQFKTLGGNLKFLAKEAAGVVIDQNPVKNTIEDNSKSSLMNPNWHIRALSFRVQKLLTAIAMRIKEYKAAELNSFDAWNNCLDMVIHLAQSYTHLWMLQQFIDTMNKVEDETIRTPLHIAESLFALTTIENDMGTGSYIVAS